MFDYDAGTLFIIWTAVIFLFVVAPIFIEFGVNIGLGFLMVVYLVVSLLCGDWGTLFVLPALALVLLWDRHFDDDKGKSYFERRLKK